MPRKNLTTTPWREKRRLQTQCNTNGRRVSKTNTQRFLRQKEATFKKAHGIFVDALETGRDRHVYVLIMEKRKTGVRYSTYNSHVDEDWVPTNEKVVRVLWIWQKLKTVRKKSDIWFFISSLIIGPGLMPGTHPTLRRHGKERAANQMQKVVGSTGLPVAHSLKRPSRS